MQYYWLNKQNNNKLIVFFAGWSFDYNPFKVLSCKDYDILFVYDYNDIENFVCDIENYQKKCLISWSMGVYTAYKLRKFLPEFEKKIAVNGTVFPVDNDYGIPEKPFILTLKHAQKGLEGKFYRNIFDKESEFEKYKENSVRRSIENRVSELNKLYEIIQTDEKFYEKYYDLAYISLKDKIIPTDNQRAFWSKFDTKIHLLDSGHFPYYNFSAWNELL